MKEEKVDFAKYLVEPHKKKSRKVTGADIPKVLEDAEILHNLCYTKVGIHPGAFAVAHPQIEKKDPLCFFVTMNKEIIINPEIVNHTKVPVERKEGCISFPNNLPIKVMRFNKIQVKFSTITKGGKISEPVTKDFSGILAEIYQHESQHFEGKYIFKYDEKKLHIQSTDPQEL